LPMCGRSVISATHCPSDRMYSKKKLATRDAVKAVV
jgi:hypothetical protein